MPFSPVKWPAMAQKWFKIFFSIFPCFLTQKDMIIGGVEIVHSKIQFFDPYSLLLLEVNRLSVRSAIELNKRLSRVKLTIAGAHLRRKLRVIRSIFVISR